MRVGSLQIDWNQAGLVVISFGKQRGRIRSIHLLVKPAYWQWGYSQSWYDGPMWDFGFGPFFLIAGM